VSASLSLLPIASTGAVANPYVRQPLSEPFASIWGAIFFGVITMILAMAAVSLSPLALRWLPARGARWAPIVFRLPIVAGVLAGLAILTRSTFLGKPLAIVPIVLAVAGILELFVARHLEVEEGTLQARLRDFLGPGAGVLAAILVVAL
jgi:hypothetical protein